MTAIPNSRTATDLWEWYEAVRKETISICAPLQTEDYVVQPIEDVSPPKWHLGHTTWFFENFILAEQVSGYSLFDERLNYFFNSYYESQGPRMLRSNRGNMTRPDVGTVLAYREHVDQGMRQLLQKNQLVPQGLYDLLVIGLQHEQQHQELLVTDLKYILGNNPLHPVYRKTDQPSVAKARPANWMALAEGLYEVGFEGEGFYWDNEKQRHKVYLYPFEIQDRLVTNGEYLEFIQAGGYEQFEHWLEEGWAFAKGQEVKAPAYWYEQDGQWFEYTLQGLSPLNMELPVTHISFFEADAYARWRGFRLPTEFEWEVACAQKHYKIPESANLLEKRLYHPSICSKARDDQFLGQCWEWTNSAYLPYPNYPRFEGALGEYNGKFMVNQKVLRGGSVATPHSHIRITYRNFFHPDKRWQFTGIRLAK